ncbi:hypothetical protein [Variovorax sp. J22R115]|uniref:hypothetical protein n=1 Tax=Variovorax sp. J22R115 TaxID=3053509 RepID=UPI0025752F9B|nr:hypothetical protein [Variovorax sp. J22R115]MDM0047628.1 hypothetical protein [Variovorax sp. J22R115]
MDRAYGTTIESRGRRRRLHRLERADPVGEPPALVREALAGLRSAAGSIVPRSRTPAASCATGECAAIGVLSGLGRIIAGDARTAAAADANGIAYAESHG